MTMILALFFDDAHTKTRNQKRETSNAMWQKSLEIRAIIFVVVVSVYLFGVAWRAQ